jgi:uncharacterized membrane protein YphA (DoxX/SURF4 family)
MTLSAPSQWAAQLVGRVLLGGIFLLAGIPKVQDPGAFAAAVRAYHLLPPSLVVPFALVLPWIEILVGAYLLAGFQTRLVSIAAGLLLAMFIVALTTALVRGDAAHACGCFGAGQSNVVTATLAGGDTIGWWDPLRDLLLLLIAAGLTLGGAGTLSIDRLLARHAQVGAQS